VEIVYFRCAGARPDLASLYERLELFSRASAGIDAALAGAGEALAHAVRTGAPLDEARRVAEVLRARGQATKNVPGVFYPDSYDPRQASDILAQVPAELERETERFCVAYAEQLGIDVVEKGGCARHHFEIGNFAEVDRLPGSTRASYYGTFERAEAIADPRLELFGNGHELVEGLLLHLLDSGRGAAAVLEIPAAHSGHGFVCALREGAELTLRVYDGEGRARPEWNASVLQGLPRARTLGNRHRIPPHGLVQQVGRIRHVLEREEQTPLLAALALFRFA
jgi:hypothetical protein